MWQIFIWLSYLFCFMSRVIMVIVVSLRQVQKFKYLGTDKKQNHYRQPFGCLWISLYIMCALSVLILHILETMVKCVYGWEEYSCGSDVCPKSEGARKCCFGEKLHVTSVCFFHVCDDPGHVLLMPCMLLHLSKEMSVKQFSRAQVSPVLASVERF